jgi:hypothetical protein
MTVTINIPVTAERRLYDEAQRAGVAVPALLEQLVIERFNGPPAHESIQAFFDRIARPAPDVDVSREGIYADL